MTVRVAVIGTGWWATRAHLPALTADPEATLVAVADPNDERRARAAERFGVPRTYADAARMLDAESLDAVVVATPHATHAALARAGLEHGLHVLIEKPMTLDPADAFGLVELAQRVGRQLVVGYPWHYNLQAIEIRQAVGADRLGTIELGTVLFASTVRELYRGHAEAYRDALGYPVNAPGDDTYSDPALAGGGQGQTQLTHAAALLLWLTDLEPERVSAQTADFELAVDLADALAVRFVGGALGCLASTGSVLPGQDEILELRVFGTEGHATWDVMAGEGALHGQGGRTAPLAPLSADQRYPEWAPARDLVAVAAGRRSSGSPGELGARVVALIDAMYRAARSGREESVRRPSEVGRTG